MEVSAQHHAPAASPPGKQLPVSIEWEVGFGHKAGLNAFEKRIISYP
jgi:hypothetical protein